MMKRKFTLFFFICVFTLLLGAIPWGSFLDANIQNNIVNHSHTEETITCIIGQLQEDAIITDLSASDYLGDIVCFSVKRISSASKSVISTLLAWIIPIFCLYLLLFQSYSYKWIQEQRKKKYSVIEYIHDLDGRKRPSYFSLSIC